MEAAQPACASYLPTIAHYYKLYTGGQDFPLLHQLKEFCSFLAIVFEWLFMFMGNCMESVNHRMLFPTYAYKFCPATLALHGSFKTSQGQLACLIPILFPQLRQEIGAIFDDWRGDDAAAYLL